MTTRRTSLDRSWGHNFARRRRYRPSQPRTGRRTILIIVSIAAVTCLVAIGLIAPRQTEHRPDVAAALVYTAPDQQTTGYQLPAAATATLRTVAAAHDSVLLVRIEGDGTVDSTEMDMTPRTDRGEVLQVPERIDQDLTAKTSTIEAQMNRSSPGTESRALYLGLLSARLPGGVPTFIFSSGIDLTAPVDTRALAWETPVDQVVEVVNGADAVPKLTGNDVTFVMAAPTGGQEIRNAQTEYLHNLWGGLLTNAGASSIQVIDGLPGRTESDQRVPIVPLPDLPGTPIPPQPDPVAPERFTCTLQTSAWFEPDKPVLLDEDLVRASLTDCVAQVAPTDSVLIEGWVAYLGALGPDGLPSDAGDVQLSQNRADTLKSVLISMGVPAEIITTHGWGAVNQPHPADPASLANRVCIITVTPSQ